MKRFRWILLGALAVTLMGIEGHYWENQGSPLTMRYIQDCRAPLECLDSGSEIVVQIQQNGITATEIAADAVGTSELNDGSDTPVAGEVVKVAAGGTTFEYLPDESCSNTACTVGTDDTVKLAVKTTQTVEGEIGWDATNDRITVGTGTATAVFYSGPHTTDTNCNGVTCSLIDDNANCDSVDTDASGALVCGVDDDIPDSDAEVPDAITVDGGTVRNSTITLQGSTAPTPTAEGQIEWDTDNDLIVVGDGTGQRAFYSGVHTGCGTGLVTSGTNCNVNFAGSGTATTVARSDHTHTTNRCFRLESPDVTSGETLPTIWRAPAAVTINEVWCESSDTTNGVILNLQRDDGTPANVCTSNVTCRAGNTCTLSSTEQNFAAGDRMDLVISATSGSSATWVTVCWRFSQ